MVDVLAIRAGLAGLDAAAAHSASGEGRPRIDEIFAPLQHAGALDPNTTIVLGARGAGKSFWAGVLGDDELRQAASDAYPNIGLDDVDVRFGYTGSIGDASVSRQTIDVQVPSGSERLRGALLWRCALLRALQSVIDPAGPREPMRVLMDRYADPEEWEFACEAADQTLAARGRRVVVLFDALDSLAEDWGRLRDLIDALLEVAWSVRGFRALRAKLFLRPDQMRDLGLKFVELPKMIAGATNLRWTGQDLYGLLYTRLGRLRDNEARDAFIELLDNVGFGEPPNSLRALRRWPAAIDRATQTRIFLSLAGAYMGRSNKKGKTYDWPLNHLADGFGEVTPRSFLTLMISAARDTHGANQVITAESIREGLKEASKVRVNQLELEFPWIKRILAPLARLQVPCSSTILVRRWRDTGTIRAVMDRATSGDFLPPFDPTADGTEEARLIGRLVRLGILTVRIDGRFDMPDLFRVAARLLKKGGVAPA